MRSLKWSPVKPTNSCWWVLMIPQTLDSGLLNPFVIRTSSFVIQPGSAPAATPLSHLRIDHSIALALDKTVCPFAGDSSRLGNRDSDIESSSRTELTELGSDRFPHPNRSPRMIRRGGPGDSSVGNSVPDSGLWTLDSGPWTLDFGPQPWRSIKPFARLIAIGAVWGIEIRASSPHLEPR